MAATSTVTEIIFSGFSQNRDAQKVISVLFLLLDVAILLGNGLIVVTVKASKGLRYLFLSYSPFVEICYCSVTAPKLMLDSFMERRVISPKGCIAQIFSLHFCGGTEIFLLTVMACGRHVAICSPAPQAVTAKGAWPPAGAACRTRPGGPSSSSSCPCVTAASAISTRC